MNDYERVARVIRYLDKHHADQPDLTVLARQAELSPFHFHRLFTNWAGVTPKDFLQCLTLAQVKESLRNGASVLESALDAGLSGPSRLHDLCVNLEAASPGEMKTGGAQWTITAGFAASPFGNCLIAESPRGICNLSFVEDGDEDAAWTGLVEEWPNARLRRNDSAAAQIAGQIYTRHGAQDSYQSAFNMLRTAPHPGPLPAGRGEGVRRTGEGYFCPIEGKSVSRVPLRAFVNGTAFQVRVWRALLEVPPGQCISYGRLAVAVGQPTAARAVGAAVGQNQLAYLIPCHRVIRETGVIGNYRWGPIRKRAIIAWECAQHTAQAALTAAAESVC